MASLFLSGLILFQVLVQIYLLTMLFQRSKYCHVSTSGRDCKYQPILLNIYFNLRKKPTGRSVLRVSVAAYLYNAFSVSINGEKNSVKVVNFKYDVCVFGFICLKNIFSSN
ncbi:hypothetical protein U3516DRAFT_657599 [Neocallimastix sp. 'constans']